MIAERSIDVSELPIGTLDSRALIWWGNIGMIVIEGTMFALLIASYIYYKTANLDWPPTTVPNPDLWSSSANVALLVLSCLPMLFADRGSLRENLTAARIGLAVCITVGIVFLAVRVMSTSTLGFKWSTHAYGSIVWTMVGMHTFHMIAATCEAALLFIYSLVRPFTKKQFLDVRALAVYWYFVALVWLPFYFIIYLLPYFSRK